MTSVHSTPSIWRRRSSSEPISLASSRTTNGWHRPQKHSGGRSRHRCDGDEVVDGEGVFPPMPLGEWEDTKATLHRFGQVVGKIRLAASVRRNHWWNVPFHLTGRGITTRPMGWDPVFAIDFDFVDHRLVVNSADGRTEAFPLEGQSVASFHRLTFEALGKLGIDVSIAKPEPFDLPGPPFAEDTGHATYDPRWAGRYWRVLGHVVLL